MSPVVQWRLVVETLVAQDPGARGAAGSPAVHEFYSEMHSAAQTPAAAAAAAPTPR